MAANRYRLVIGNKNWSSWSLRPWLAMRRLKLPFEEINVRLRLADSKAEIMKYSPSGLVPLLLDGDMAIWDSLAILEYLAEAHPDAGLWPADRRARALARCVSAEMHSGFAPLRNTCSMELLATNPLDSVPEDVETNVRRIIAIWRQCRGDFGNDGPFLFGAFTAADAMYAPVASRFRTYLPDLAKYGDDGTAAAYVATIFAMPEMETWTEGAKAEVASAT
ncbi:MAG: glutathione S-transferase family protein [Hyphomicrobium sp.]|uniref:glutathione S-transferase family protein n=1 Tax=Hyphomicrobium sp. TaxID=82 RepID=UPI001329D31F|nr:glutathione S-transferase family protein [Hyphomicrobium sp.]KAB2941781.1 MAG: glutathione S-transferase family protein [Hyphomicrobium sp.]MBZ0210047.1 glutathione S-transferase family protein [Hyphomicrobium sp.]